MTTEHGIKNRPKSVEEEVITKDQLEASICRESFYDYLQRHWSCMVSEEPVWNWHIKFLCDELQALAERVFLRLPKLYDLIVNISPGTTKSTICSIAFPIWVWTRDLAIRSICGSYAFPLSLELGNKSRRLVMSDKHKRLFPEIQLDQASKGLLTTTGGGQRIATSTGGSITGMHGHFIIIDDPINPREALSEVILSSANDWIDHTLMTRKVHRELTPTILIMQRLRQNDPTGHIRKTRDSSQIRRICLPATKTDKIRPRRLRRLYKDGLMDPVRLSHRALESAERELGTGMYQGQYLQDPIPLGIMMFKIDEIEIRTSAPPPIAIIRYWDKAGTKGGGAYTVGVKMGRYADNRIIVLDVKRGQWEASAREHIIKQTTVADGVGVLVGVEQEPGSGGKESAEYTRRNLAGFRVLLDRPVGDKVMRADPFAVQVNGGNVTLLQGPWNNAYLNEMQYFCATASYKDQIDASSGAFAALNRFGMSVGALR